ncbi:MAG TPA: hypothetical protein VM756_05405 [Burkholderiales bacterium]|nr:hypothetical protein [Burkholderiales bacterium]
MADLVVDKHISVVLDVMHFRKAERTRFATAFAEQFFHRKKTARSACHLFIEEAQAYLPQMVRGEEARMVGVFEDIGKVGRNYGIGNSLISQRPQAINKDVLNQVEVLLAFQTNGPQERKAIAGWTAENTTAGATMMQDLPKLRVGEALVWSPQWLRLAEKVHIGKRETYDASRTPTGAAKAIKPKTLAKTDLEQLGEQIAATIEKAKSDDPRELRKQLAEANRMLANQAKAIGELQARQPAGKEKRVEVPVLKDAQIARLEKALDRIAALQDAFVSKMTDSHAAVTTIASDLLTAVRRVNATPITAVHARGLHDTGAHPRSGGGADGRSPVQRAPVSTARSDAGVRGRPHAAGTAEGNGHTTGVEQRILNALAELDLLGQSQPAREIVALLSGYTHLNSKGLINGLGALRSKGLIDYPSQGVVALTDEGRAVAVYPDAPRSSQEIQDRVCALLGGASSRILHPLIEAYPHAMARQDVAAAANYGHLNSKGFVNAIGRLRTLGFVDYPDRGTVKANPVLFLDR